MKVPVFKAQKASGRAACKGPYCKRKSDYISPKGKIIKNTICGVVSVQTSETPGCLYQYFYCRGCVDWVLQEARRTFDPNFWHFD